MAVLVAAALSGYWSAMNFGVRLAWSVALFANVLSIALGRRGDPAAAQALFALAIAGFAWGGLRFVQAREGASSHERHPGWD